MAENRKAPRKPLRYAAWLHEGDDQPRDCVLADVSATGARLEVDDPTSLPDTFLLLLSGKGFPRRACRVVWRTDRHVGVEFGNLKRRPTTA